MIGHLMMAFMLPVPSPSFLPVSIVDALPARGVSLLSGSNHLSEVAHLWIADLTLHGIPLLIVDCAIRFDVFRLVDEALCHDMNPDVLLAAVMVQRVFTPYHILEAVSRADQERRPLTVLLAPMKQFFDGDVAEEEGLFLLRRLVARLRSACSPFLVIERTDYSHPTFAVMFPELEAAASVIWKLTDHRVIQKTDQMENGLWGVP